MPAPEKEHREAHLDFFGRRLYDSVKVDFQNNIPSHGQRSHKVVTELERCGCGTSSNRCLGAFPNTPLTGMRHGGPPERERESLAKPTPPPTFFRLPRAIVSSHHSGWQVLWGAYAEARHPVKW